jgi:hypothetical protein
MIKKVRKRGRGWEALKESTDQILGAVQDSD